MITIKEMIKQANLQGYVDDNAESKVCQDIILKALSVSSMNRNATIKGGVVMRSISNDARRATLDMDIDFIRYSLDDDSIRKFINKLNCVDGITVELIGQITELKQQDYHGKRVFVRLIDATGDSIESKIDLGVHKNLSIEQEEYCFDLSSFDEGVSLLINSKEQMFTEKLRSLLKFGYYSTRSKDIFDLSYLADLVDKRKLLECFQVYIFDDENMRENNMMDVCRRVNQTFSSDLFVNRLSQSKQNWIGKDCHEVLNNLVDFFNEIQ